MDLSKLTKDALLVKCCELGITKCKSKNKTQLIELINVHNTPKHDQELLKQTGSTTSSKNNVLIKFIIEDSDDDSDEDDSDEDDSIECTNNDSFQSIVNDDEKEINNANNLKFIDLFCGIGGFHQALSKLGAQCVLACDIDKDCRKVYADNYDIEPVSNVKEIDEKTMPDFDILCAGFPCQAFSNGGKKKCFEDERGLLFDEIVRIAREKRPKFMFLENVKHILKVSNGEVIEYIRRKIDQLGYNLQLFQISPHNYGIPQQRERVYFVCVRKDIYCGQNVELRKYVGKLDFNKFLDKESEIDDKYFIKGDTLNVLEAWDEMVKQFEVGEKISPTILINDAYKQYTEQEFKLFPAWKQEYITKNKPLLTKYQSQFAEWYAKHSELLQKREIYGKLEWQTGLIKEGDSIFNHFIQIRQSGIRVKKGQYFPTLVAIGQIPIYGKEKRYITPRECARLQSFPETFRLASDDKKSYKQLGNSVNVSNVYNVISSTLKLYGM